MEAASSTPDDETMEEKRDNLRDAISEQRALTSAKNEESIVLGEEACHVKTTLSESTRELYALTSRRLFHRYLRYESRSHETNPSSVDAAQFACFLPSLKPTWKLPTWRMNSQA